MRRNLSPASGIVLAGGRSSRFGRDKLLEPVAGRPLLDHAVLAVSSVAREVIVLGGGAGGDATALPRAAVPIRRIPDAEPFGGPLVALAGGLDLVRGPLALVVGGDMPTLAPAVLQALLEALDAADGADAAALLLRGRPQPLPIALRVAGAAPVARRLVAAGERRLSALEAALPARRLDESDWRRFDRDAATLRDVDRPADLTR